MITARTLKLTHGTTTTIAGSFNVKGSFGVHMNVVSDTASPATLSANIGIINMLFLDMQYIVGAGLSTWNNVNGTDNGNNTNINFLIVPIIQAFVGSSWKVGKKLQIRVGGAWKNVIKAQILINGVWKSIF